MKSINFLQIALIIAAGILYLYDGSPAYGDGGRQCVGGRENSAKGCSGSCCTSVPGAGKSDEKAAKGKEDRAIPADKTKPKGETGGKVEDFCRLKDLH